MDILIKPIPCTIEIMDMLESRGIINRLCPGHDTLEVEKGKSRHETLYSSDEAFGPHKLICVTINSVEPTNFLYHNDAEDFLLIDFPHTEELILTISLDKKDVLIRKIEEGVLEASDFISIICNKNDPYTSFFTMNKEYAHVETCMRASEHPPSFYVTESRDLDENMIDLKSYKLIIENE